MYNVYFFFLKVNSGHVVICINVVTYLLVLFLINIFRKVQLLCEIFNYFLSIHSLNYELLAIVVINLSYKADSVLTS
jgi:hypothetical protein